MSLVDAVERADEWFEDELGPELYAAREDLRDEQFEYITTEALDNLDEMQAELDHHFNALERAAERLDWSCNSQKQEYLQNLDSQKQTLASGLHAAVETRELPKDRYQEMSDAIAELRDCAAGLLEDL